MTEPTVSVIVPCYNEQNTIDLLLNALLEQIYPQENIEVIISDGMSTDQTRQRIAEFQQTHPEFRIQIVDNLQRTIPAALNRAIEAAQGEMIVRLDAHSIPRPDYVARCVDALEAGLGQNVGGIWEIRPGSSRKMARAIALAAAHPFGVGDARYRVGGEPQAVDTVPFGAFRKSLFEKIGNFDESLLSNEDYEFNARIRQHGFTVWLDPNIRSVYFARSTLRGLARQYWRYGYWKVRMLLRYPDSFRWRQLSGAFVLTWLGLGIFSIWFVLARWLLLLEALFYGTALLIAAIQSARQQRDFGLIWRVPLVIAVMHFSWGSAFIWSLLEYLIRGNKSGL